MSIGLEALEVINTASYEKPYHKKDLDRLEKY